MKKRAPKKQKTYSGDEVKRHLSVLIEHTDDNFKLIREDLVGIHRKLDEHTHILGEHTRKFDSHAEMIAKIMQDVAILKGDMDIVKSGFKQKPDYKEFMALQRRVRVLESKVK